MLAAVFGVFQLILILMHAVIYRTLATSFGWTWPWFEWLFVIFSITFVTASVLAHLYCNTFVKWYYRFAAYWFGLTIFLYVGALGVYFIEWIIYANNYYLAPALVGGVVMGLVFLVHTYATWQTRRIKVTRVTVAPVAGMAAWPQAWHGKKIVFVSDVHLGAVLGDGFARKVTAAIAKESPEAVLIGGDIFDGVRCHPTSLLKSFADLRTPQGVFFASGNHEYYIKDVQAALKEIEAMGIKLLDNEIFDLKGIQLVGVDWKDTYKKEEFEKTMARMKIDRTKPSILMRHEPNHLGVAERAGITLTLSGHTHAGQIWPLGYITNQIYLGFDYGLKQLGKMMVYTSSGVGTWGPPLRFGTKAEIVAVTFK